MPDTPHIQFGDNAQVHGPVVGGNVNTLHYNTTSPSHSPQELQNRHRMLARVRVIWISGELAHSLYATARIELGLKDASDVVANPWRLVLEQPQSPIHFLPPAPLLPTYMMVPAAAC